MLGPQELVRRSCSPISAPRSRRQTAPRCASSRRRTSRRKGLLTTLERFSERCAVPDHADRSLSAVHPAASGAHLRPAAARQGEPTTTTPTIRRSPGAARSHAGEARRLFRRTWRNRPALSRADTSLPARYARAISAYRFGRLPGIAGQIDGLIAAEPSNAYFWELKGQVLLESGRTAPKRSRHCARPRAMAPNAVPMKVLYGHALVATDTSGQRHRGDRDPRQCDAARSGLG